MNPWDADHVAEHVSSKIDNNNSEGTLWTTQREWPVECSWRDCWPLERRRILGWCQLEDICQKDPVLTARREEVARVHSEGFYETVPMQDCKDAGEKLLELIWVDADKSVDPAHKKILSRLCAREYTTKQGNIQSLTSFSVVLWNVTSRICEGACLNHDVSEFVEQRETIEVETLRHQQSTFSRNSPESHIRTSSSRRSSEIWRRQSWQIDQEHVWNSTCFSHLATWLGDPDLWRVGRIPKKQTQCSFVPQLQRMRMAVHGDDCVFVRRWWTKTHRQTSEIQVHSERRGNIGVRRFRRKSLLFLNRVFRFGTDQTGQYLTLNLLWDTHHSSSMNLDGTRTQNSENTIRETTRQVGVGRMKEFVFFKGEDATRYRSACVRLSYLDQDRLDLAETAKHLAQRMPESEWTSWIRLLSTENVQRDVWLGNP